LLAMRVVVRVRSLLSVEISIRSIFENQTLEGFAAHVEGLRQEQLLKRVMHGEADVAALLEQVTAMSEGQVSALIQQLRTGGKV
jgi:hypothetical protein